MIKKKPNKDEIKSMYKLMSDTEKDYYDLIFMLESEMAIMPVEVANKIQNKIYKQYEP